MRQVRLNNGMDIPQIGFGVYKATDQGGYSVLAEAIRTGYRHLDTAEAYGNEEEVGQAVCESGIPREAFFITSKLNRNCLGYENAKKECEKSLQRLKTDYLDLYLMHWPRPDYGMDGFDDWERLDIETWHAMEELVQEGKVRGIGVSNFLPHHMDNLLKEASIVPCVNQLELHPGYLQEEAVAYCREKGIALSAYSPIGRARLMKHPLLLELAEKYNTSTADFCLTFELQSGFIIIPKSTHPERMKANLNAGGYVIANEDMEAVRRMPQAGWSGQHPDRENTDPQTEYK